ncbi:MAG: cold-shock DNA-binding domain protein [Edaphobacter sp.]|nr:cold-shock DNA-binding domain protein [Edaphobacter sp.]
MAGVWVYISSIRGKYPRSPWQSSFSTVCGHKPIVREDALSHYKGIVKWFNNAKGYGFLGHDGGADVFVHYSSIKREGYKTLKEGDPVEFDIIQGDKGPQADQVSVFRVPA